MPLIRVILRELLPQFISNCVEQFSVLILINTIYFYVSTDHSAFLSLIIPFSKLSQNLFTESFRNIKAQVAHHIRLSQSYAAQIFATTTFVVAIILNLIITIVFGLLLKKMFSSFPQTFIDTALPYLQYSLFFSTISTSLLSLCSFILRSQQQLMMSAVVYIIYYILYSTMLLLLYYINGSSPFIKDQNSLFQMSLYIEIVCCIVTAVPIFCTIFGIIPMFTTQIVCSFKVLLPFRWRIYQDIFKQMLLTIFQVVFQPLTEVVITIFYIKHVGQNPELMNRAIAKTLIFYTLYNLSNAPNLSIQQILEPLLCSNIQLGRNDRIMKSIFISVVIGIVSEAVFFMLLCGLYLEIIKIVTPQLGASDTTYQYYLDDCKVLQFAALKGLLGTGYHISLALNTAFGNTWKVLIQQALDYLMLIVGIIILVIENSRYQFLELLICCSILQGVFGYMSLIDLLIQQKKKKQKLIADLIQNDESELNLNPNHSDNEIMEIGALSFHGDNDATSDNQNQNEMPFVIRPLSGNIIQKEAKQLGVSALDVSQDVGQNSSTNQNNSDPKEITDASAFQNINQQQTEIFTQQNGDVAMDDDGEQPKIQLLALEE